MRKLICMGLATAMLTAGCFGAGAPSCSDSDVKGLVLKILTGGAEGRSLGSIRTNSINKEAKRSVCEGDLIYSNGYKMPIVYIAQRTEDGKIYAEVSYK